MSGDIIGSLLNNRKEAIEQEEGRVGGQKKPGPSRPPGEEGPQQKRPRKKKRRRPKKRLIKSPRTRRLLLVLGLVLGLLYVPGLFMAPAPVRRSLPATIKVEGLSSFKEFARLTQDEDYDGDGIINSREITIRTNPFLMDTDGDGVTDYAEVYIYETNPNVPDAIMEKKMKELDKEREERVDTPYKVNDVVLWAEDYTSKSQGSVIRVDRGYHFKKFNGKVVLPVEGYFYRYGQGVHEPIQVKGEDGSFRVESLEKTEIIRVFAEPLPKVYELRVANRRAMILRDNFFTQALDWILPQRGLLASIPKTQIDVQAQEPEVMIEDFDRLELDTSLIRRFFPTNKIADLIRVRRELDSGELVGINLYQDGIGETQLICYGYDPFGDLLIADYESKEPLGLLTIVEEAVLMETKDGPEEVASFQFEGAGFSSYQGSIIHFYSDQDQAPLDKPKEDQGEEQGLALRANMKAVLVQNSDLANPQVQEVLEEKELVLPWLGEAFDYSEIRSYGPLDGFVEIGSTITRTNGFEAVDLSQEMERKFWEENKKEAEMDVVYYYLAQGSQEELAWSQDPMDLGLIFQENLERLKNSQVDEVGGEEPTDSEPPAEPAEEAGQEPADEVRSPDSVEDIGIPGVTMDMLTPEEQEALLREGILPERFQED